MYEYEAPDFLVDQGADEIHERMLESLPDDIDKSEGNIPWDFTRPSALEKAEFAGFTLNETIKLMFPQWAYAKWLDLHGERELVMRREANYASGILEVTGEPGTVIPKGFEFATPAGLTASVVFKAMEECRLEGAPDSGGMVTNEIAVQAAEGGICGNVAVDTVKLMVNPIRNISYVTNPEAMSGGSEEEGDDEYRIRILDAMRRGSSMTGCNADYIRWGKEVAAVGQVIVEPEWDDPAMPEQFHYTDLQGNKKCAGAVRLIIIDNNGLPANRQILDAVYCHIAGTGEDDAHRLMPIGAHLTVIAPAGLTVDIRAAVTLGEDEDVGAVAERFKIGLNEYWLAVGKEAMDDEAGCIGHVRVVQVGAVLAKTKGVLDYEGLALNGGVENIPVTRAQYPVTGEVELYAKA